MFLERSPTKMFDTFLSTPLDDTLRLDWSSKYALLSKPRVFVVLPKIKPQFLIQNSKGFIFGSELGMLEIFARALLIKNHCYCYYYYYYFYSYTRKRFYWVTFKLEGIHRPKFCATTFFICHYTDIGNGECQPRIGLFTT